jgi:chromosome partitioning protein
MITIAVVNTKGGVGKTTICASLAVRAARESERVAALDLDPQLSLVEWWKRRGKGDNPTLFEGCDAADAVERANLTGYDWLFLDGPPAILQIVQEAIGVADFTLIPVKPSMVDLLATQDTVAIAADAGVPFLCVFNDVASGEKVVESAKALLFNHKVPIVKTVVTHRVSLSRVWRSASPLPRSITAETPQPPRTLMSCGMKSKQRRPKQRRRAPRERRPPMSENETEEGMDFVSQFQGAFAAKDAMLERLKRERRAAETPKQKARRGKPKKQVNFRATEETLKQLEDLAEGLGKSTTDIIALAIDMLARTHLGAKK